MKPPPPTAPPQPHSRTLPLSSRCSLDTGGNGYITASDWGNVAAADMVNMFTLKYMRRFMGLPEERTPKEDVSH